MKTSYPYWLARKPGGLRLLIGVRAIAGYCHVSTRTYYTWMRGLDFPASRLPDGRWVTSVSLIDEWVRGLKRGKSERGGDAIGP